MDKTGFRSPLGRVRGLGSAKDGTHRWWLQRLTAAAMVPLVLLVATYIIMLAGEDHLVVREVLGRPFTAGVVLVLVGALFWHLRLGLQVVIEDYVHTEATKLVLMVAVTFACIGLAVANAFAVLSMAIGG